MRCVQKPREFGIRNRGTIDIEILNVHLMPVEAARGFLPWVLHIHAGVVPSFDFDPAHLKVVLPTGIRTIPSGAARLPLTAGISLTLCDTAVHSRE